MLIFPIIWAYFSKSNILIQLSVRAFDAIVPRFNSLAEPARTVGQFRVLIRRQNRPLYFLCQNRFCR